MSTTSETVWQAEALGPLGSPEKQFRRFAFTQAGAHRVTALRSAAARIVREQGWPRGEYMLSALVIDVPSARYVNDPSSVTYLTAAAPVSWEQVQQELLRGAEPLV